MKGGTQRVPLLSLVLESPPKKGVASALAFLLFYSISMASLQAQATQITKNLRQHLHTIGNHVANFSASSVLPEEHQKHLRAMEASVIMIYRGLGQLQQLIPQDSSQE